MAPSPTTYKDLNAEKFPEPVEPLGVHRDALSVSTINMKDPHMRLAFSLAVIHNILRRSLRSVAKHARTQPSPPSPEFIQYASFVMKFLHAHHEHEDLIFFPITEPYVNFSESSHEHEDIVLLIAAVSDTMNVGGETLAKNVEALLEVLDVHLGKEEWLTNMYARRLPVHVIEEAEEKLQVEVDKENKECGAIWALTFIKRSMNKEENALFPEMPWIVKAVITMIGNWVYRKQFAFAPY